jgi:hypothetical protein
VTQLETPQKHRENGPKTLSAGGEPNFKKFFRPQLREAKQFTFTPAVIAAKIHLRNWPSSATFLRLC